MKPLYEYSSYRKYVIDRLASPEFGGRGFKSRFAKFLGIQTSFLSQVLKEDKHLSEEHIFKAATFFQLKDLDQEYFITLGHLEKAGNFELEDYYKSKLAKLRDASLKLSNKIKSGTDLSLEDQAKFYSDWLYAAIRLSTSLPQINTIMDIANYLKEKPEKVAEIIKFLKDRELVGEEGGSYKLGVKNTHLGSHSPLITNHHKNWRLQAMRRHTDEDPNNLFFSAPMTIAKKDFFFIREEITKLIHVVVEAGKESAEEELYCLNIDWMKVV